MTRFEQMNSQLRFSFRTLSTESGSIVSNIMDTLRPYFLAFESDDPKGNWVPSSRTEVESSVAAQISFKDINIYHKYIKLLVKTLNANIT